jgi:uncharacterized protein (DUF1330 family)
VYHALTYESQCKEGIEKAWGEYLAKWNTANPDEKPEKARLIFLMEFMKERLAEESDEMKEKVEEYHLSVKEESPSPVETDHDRNVRMQKQVSIIHFIRIKLTF